MRYYIETYGCSRNVADSEVIQGILDERYERVGSPEEADLVVVNSCTVKTATEQKIFARIRKLGGKKLIIAGCMPEVNVGELEKIAPDAALVGPHHVREIGEVANSLLEGKVEKRVGQAKETILCLPRVRKNPVVAIVPICSGCVSNCTYCCTRIARGKLHSYPVDLIKREIENSLKDGCKEVWITAEDTIAYGKDSGSSLPKLLNEICKIVGNFKIRVGMMNPQHVLPVLDELIGSYKNEKMFKFLHLPVQSGNDGVLRNMHRGYSVEQFRRIVEKFREEIPELTLSTDVIVGFPEETYEQFLDSMKLVEEVKPDIVNVSRFGARPGTEAAKMKQISENEKKRRSRELSAIVGKVGLEQNKKWVGWEGRVLVDEEGKDGTYIGRNFAYKPVVLKFGTVGEKVQVKIPEAAAHYLVSDS